MVDQSKLQEVDVAFIKVGAQLAGILYDDKGKMLWPARVPIPYNFLFKLREKDIKKVYYVPPKDKSYVDREPMFSAETQKFAENAIDEIVTQINYGKVPEANIAKNTIQRIFEEMQKNAGGFLNLMVLKEYDYYTYFHSINVGILSMFLTRKLGFNHNFIQDAGLGGFLHDIGKVKISSKIVNKQAILTSDEFRIMKNHPVLGYNIIKEDGTLSNFVKKMVLFHHERWDGTGYPLKLRAEAIGNFASIVAVCDVYDALTTERSYKKALTVNDALLYIMRNTLIHFNPYVSQRFINEMAQMYDLGSFYPVGAFALLNTGEVCYITGKDNEYAMRPQTIILEKRIGEPLRNPIQADLKLDLSRSIIKTVDDPERIEKLSMLI